MHPLDELAIACGSAAQLIRDARARHGAVLEAERIRITAAERFDRGIGKIARLGRAALRRLDTLEEGALADTEDTLKGCAVALRDRRNTEVVETWLGKRKRKDEHAPP